MSETTQDDLMRHWIAGTLHWLLEQHDPMETRGQAAERQSRASQLRPPSGEDWPIGLLQQLPATIDASVEEHRNLEQFEPRLQTLMRNLSFWLQQWVAAKSRQDFAAAHDGSRLIGRLLNNVYEALHRNRLSTGMRETLVTLLSLPAGEVIVRWRHMVTANPPLRAEAAVASAAMLLQRRDLEGDQLFPELIACLWQPSMTTAVVQLANHCHRQSPDEPHALDDELPRLQELLAAVIERLERFEHSLENASLDSSGVASIHEAIDLCVALCDAVALCEYPPAQSSLERAAKLRHRRIVCEATYALAKQGDAAATQLLIGLAAEPVIRLRVLQYAEELGLGDRIAEQWLTPAAVAQSHVALYLASPEVFGVAPTNIELIDDETLAWPGYEAPQTCYLFRYTYAAGDRSHSNIAIAGPLVRTTVGDLAELPVEDIYSLYAGWQAEHPEIREFPLSELLETDLASVDQLTSDAETDGFDDVVPQRLGRFFGTDVLLASASRDDVAGVLIADGNESLFYPHTGRPRPLSLEEAYCVYKGRRLLRTFNP